MLVVENLPAIERWLAKLPDERRMELNRPITVWRGFLAATKGSKQSDKWRDRKPMPAEDFNKVPAAVAEALPSGEVITIAIAVIRAQGFAVPRDVSCGRELVLLHATLESLQSLAVIFQAMRGLEQNPRFSPRISVSVILTVIN